VCLSRTAGNAAAPIRQRRRERGRGAKGLVGGAAAIGLDGAAFLLLPTVVLGFGWSRGKSDGADIEDRRFVLKGNHRRKTLRAGRSDVGNLAAIQPTKSSFSFSGFTEDSNSSVVWIRRPPALLERVVLRCT
jgi:hypothetical protein